MGSGFDKRQLTIHVRNSLCSAAYKPYRADIVSTPWCPMVCQGSKILVVLCRFDYGWDSQGGANAKSRSGREWDQKLALASASVAQQPD